MKANCSDLGVMGNRFWKKLRDHWKKLRAHKFVLYVLIPLALFSLAVFIIPTQHLRIEAKTGSVEIEFSPGQPIAWALGGARLLDCLQLALVAPPSRATLTKESQEQLKDGAEIELPSTVRARLSLDGSDLLVELTALAKPKNVATMAAPECSKDRSRMAVLDTGDGKRSGISLPALLRLDGGNIGNGLTLEFRGDIRVGNDVTSGRQPLLTSGRLTFRQVRSIWPHWLADAQFDIESRDLGLGDKITVASLDGDSEDAPQGFVRIVKEDRGTEMSVYATTVAGRTRIVHPFSAPESPKSNLFRRAWADELLSILVAFILTLISLYIAWLQYMAPSNGPKDR